MNDITLYWLLAAPISLVTATFCGRTSIKLEDGRLEVVIDEIVIFLISLAAMVTGAFMFSTLIK